MQTLPFNTVRDIFTLSYSIIISKPYSNFNDSEPFLKHFVALKNAAFDPTNQNPNIYRETISKKRRFYCVYTLFQALIYYYSVSHRVNVDNKIMKIKKNLLESTGVNRRHDNKAGPFWQARQ